MPCHSCTQIISAMVVVVVMGQGFWSGTSGLEHVPIFNTTIVMVKGAAVRFWVGAERVDAPGYQ